MNIWNEKNTNKKQSELDYYTKYELLKKKSMDLRKSNSDPYDEEIPDENFEREEGKFINDVPHVDIKSNMMKNNQKNDSFYYIPRNKQICVTEPEETFHPQFLESLSINKSNNTPQQLRSLEQPCYYFNHQKNLMNTFTSFGGLLNCNNCIDRVNKGSFISSTQYSSNKRQISNDFDLENEEQDLSELQQKTFLKEYSSRIPTNESNDSDKPSLYTRINYHRPCRTDLNDVKTFKNVNNSTMNYYNNFSLNANKTTQTSSQSQRGKKNYKALTNKIEQMLNKNEKQFLNLEDIARGKEQRTTLMIRNVPIKYTDEMLMKELSKFDKKYNCLYMPFDYEKGGNKGYAFINFTHPLHILLFQEYFEGKSWNYFESKKICELNFANFQGINEIKKHAKNYKGIKKPTFIVIPDDAKVDIEVPLTYLEIFLERYKNMKYVKNSKTFLIKSFD